MKRRLIGLRQFSCGARILALTLMAFVVGACSSGGDRTDTPALGQAAAGLSASSKVSCTVPEECPAGATCVKGACECSDTGSAPCSDPAISKPFCPSPYDSQNCGKCGHSCSADKPLCFDGDCRTCEEIWPEASPATGSVSRATSTRRPAKPARTAPAAGRCAWTASARHARRSLGTRPARGNASSQTGIRTIVAVVASSVRLTRRTVKSVSARRAGVA
jgi:hypothetical protein